jgi:nitrate reductase gamma subunit
MDFYAFVEGPLTWVAILTFLIGIVVRGIFYYNASKKTDKMIHKYFSWKWVFSTYAKWLLPNNVTFKKQPLYYLTVYLFHICIVMLPVFAYQHIVMWEMSRFGWSWISLPAGLAKWMTLAVVLIGLFLIARRAMHPDLKLLTKSSDYLLLALTILPFLTGYLAAHATLGTTGFLAENMQLFHMLSGQLMLILIPFTKLSHAVLFFFSRGATAVEFGRRGYSM